MILKKITAGPFQANNYLLIDEKNKKAILIDASGDFNTIEKYLKEYDATLEYILNTHGHVDHISGNFEIQTKLGAKALLHKSDLPLVDLFEQQIELFGLPPETKPAIDGNLEDGQIVECGDIKLKVIHTPGHSPGGVCLLDEKNKMLFSGDTLFFNSVGRTDLMGGSFDTLEKSVEDKLFLLDPSITVYPGHGCETTIEREKKSNPFFGEIRFV